MWSRYVETALYGDEGRGLVWRREHSCRDVEIRVETWRFVSRRGDSCRDVRGLVCSYLTGWAAPNNILALAAVLELSFGAAKLPAVRARGLLCLVCSLARKRDGTRLFA